MARGGMGIAVQLTSNTVRREGQRGTEGATRPH